MIQLDATIVNPLGLHARPAAQLVKLANTFSSDIQLLKEGVPVNGKSIMGVMILAAECGSIITIRAQGEDEDAAVNALAGLVRSGFGE
ncbi:MAG TPA: HPr family phosphocarrier protein [Gemmatimonadales bacterium]|nr:HPr family phosphocarrier protein [Gemmatimonadales bacterium]